MEKAKRRGIKRVFLVLIGSALAGLMLGCEKESTGPETPVLKEADVVGTWRTSVAGTGFTVKVVMAIAADHSVNFSQKFAGMIAEKPDSTLDRSDESGTWSLTNGMLKSNKVTCRYGALPDFKLTAAPCTAPITKDYSVVINGNTMTVVEGTATYVFIKD